MRPRHLRLVLALLLPLMVLRALLPAGTMPVAEDGALRIVMCSAGLVLDAGEGGDELPSGTGDCLFAHAATPAPPARDVVALVAPLQPVQFLPAESAPRPPASGPPRSAAARAPPFALI